MSASPDLLADAPRPTDDRRSPMAGLTSPFFAYRPQLDGIRAVAVLAVIAYNGHAGWARGGFLGVDLFFVLSGYLITTLLLLEGDRTGGIDLGRFWMRRARRLLPALVAVVAACVIYGRFNAELVDLGKLRADSIATLGYVANWWYVASGSSYFEQFATPSLLKHTWSLAIEEQFYLCWPLLVGFGLRILGRSRQRWIALLCVLAGLSAIAMAVVYNPLDPSRAYYGTDSRLQALAIGAAAAFVLHRRRLRTDHRAIGRLCLLGGAGMTVMFAVADSQAAWMYRGGFTLFAVLAAIVIGGVVAAPASPLSRALSVRPLPAIGRISYGMYLWHWPIYVVLAQQTSLNGIALILVDLVLTMAIATVSYRVVERPIRERRVRRTPSVAVLAALAVVTVVLVVTTSGSPTSTVEAAVAGDTDVPASALGSPIPANSVRTADDTAVLLVGDSVAYGLGNNFKPDIAGGGLFLYNDGRIGCGVVPGTPISSNAQIERDAYGCDDVRDIWARLVREQHPDVVLMLPGGHEVFDLDVDGTVLRVGTPEHHRYVVEQLSRDVDLLSKDGAKVVILSTPCFDQRNEKGLSAFVEPPHERTAAEAWRVDELNDVWRDVAQRYPDTVSVVDLHGFTCPNGTYELTLDGEELHVDGVHFSRAGAQAVWRWLGPQLRAVAG